MTNQLPVKKDETGKFCLYLNGKRAARLFNKLSSVKTALKKLDKEMQSAGEEPADLDD